MSYILDALKRSEQERHQGELAHASIDTIMMPKRHTRNQLWPYVIIVLLLVNLSAYLFFQFQGASEETSIGQSHSVEEPLPKLSVSTEVKKDSKNKESIAPSLPVNAIDASLSSNTAQVDISADEQNQVDQNQAGQFKALPEHVLNTPQFTQRFELPELHKQSSEPEEHAIELTDDGLEIVRPKNFTESTSDLASHETSLLEDEAQSETIKTAELKKPISATTNTVVTPPKEDIQVAVHKVDNFDNVRLLSDMDANLQRSIPDIRFNSHIFASNPEDRRVMINDLYLRENQMFSGLTIKTIGEFYIVLEKDGQSFKIPVLRDWYSPK